MPRVHRITDRKSGAVHKYHRRTRVRLPSDIPEDHPDFIAAWQVEEAKGSRPVKRLRATQGTVAWACEAFLASNDYLSLNDGYRAVIGRHVRAIMEKGAQAQVRGLSTRHVEADLAALTGGAGQHRHKAWRKLGPFWKTQGLTETDITHGIPKPKLAPSEGHTPWSEADVSRFRAYWGKGTPPRLMMELYQWTGARAVDLVRLGPPMVQSDGMLVFKQRKTRVETYVPWTGAPEGMEIDFANMQAELPTKTQFTFLQSSHGKARSSKSLTGMFSRYATEAGLPNLTGHGLRKYRLNMLAEMGFTVTQMQAWCGHASTQELDHYTRRANKRRSLSVKLEKPARNYEGKSIA